MSTSLVLFVCFFSRLVLQSEPDMIPRTGERNEIQQRLECSFNGEPDSQFFFIFHLDISIRQQSSEYRSGTIQYPQPLEEIFLYSNVERLISKYPISYKDKWMLETI